MGQWSGISDFFAMGGYAQYVWGAYGMVFFCFFCEYTKLPANAIIKTS